MSITVTTDIFCTDCSQWIHGTISNRAKIREARRIAKKEGWNYIKSPYMGKMVDVCPECSKHYKSLKDNEQ